MCNLYLFCLFFQVVTLMNVDLLRHQQCWKEGLNCLRIGFATLQAQVYLYKSLQVSFFDSLYTAYVLCYILCTGFQVWWHAGMAPALEPPALQGSWTPVPEGIRSSEQELAWNTNRPHFQVSEWTLALPHIYSII